MTISLDLGCGHNMNNPFGADSVVGVDPGIDHPSVLKAWVGIEDIPLNDNTVDYVTAYDFIEHVPRFILKEGKPFNPFIHTMNEIWRVCKHGGKVFCRTPAYPTPQAFQDPTHVNFITEQTIRYFTGQMPDQLGNQYGAHYGFIGMFRLDNQTVWNKAWLEWHLTCIKNK